MPLAGAEVVAWIGGPLDPSFDLETDGGCGECLMYFMEFVVIVVLIRMFMRFRQPVYACWAVLGVYLLLDDSL